MDMMENEELEDPTRTFADQWRSAFGDVPPLGFRLRPAFPDRWVRFHALPGSKRDARSPAKRKEVLHRANSLGAALFELGAPVWLVIPQEGSLAATWITAHGAREALAWRDPDEDPLEAWEWVFCAAPARWQPGAFDDLFLGVAGDRGQAVLADLRAFRVLAPYDGGFDVIWSSREVDWLRRQFASWLSPRDDRF